MKDFSEIFNFELLNQESGSIFPPICIDSRVLSKGDVFCAINGNNFDGHKFVEAAFNKGALFAIVEKDNQVLQLFEDKSRLLAVDDSIDALSRIANLNRKKSKARVLCISGSAGKTGTKELINNILSTTFSGIANEKNFNNYIGLPLTLLKLKNEDEYCILELGINTIGEMDKLANIAQPDWALLTNVGASHLEGLKDIETVAKEKTKLFRAISVQGKIFVNIDDPNIVTYSKDNEHCEKLTFSMFDNTGADVFISRTQEKGLEGYDLTVSAYGELFDVNLPLLGRHNINNALAAIAVTYSWGLDIDNIARGLNKPIFSDRRNSLIQLKNNKYLIDDSYNSNPLSVKAALELFKKLAGNSKTLFVVGDMLEQGSESKKLHKELGISIKEQGIDKVIAIGQYAESIAQGFNNDNNIMLFKDHREASNEALKQSDQCDWILIKGSRGISLDLIADRIKGEYGL
ncbi:MAG: UDP-N-acetylmuramoyl-tripeptide--D-alanyl-D-alanine ligase [Pseudomonadota bacterium]